MVFVRWDMSRGVDCASNPESDAPALDSGVRFTHVYPNLLA